MRHVKEERPLLVFLDERHRALGVLRGELFLILAGDLGIDDRVAVDQRQMRPTLEPLLHRQMHHARMVRPHVVGVRQAKIIIEAVLQRQKFFVMSEVPLAVARCGVAPLFAQFRERRFVRVNAMPRLRPERAEDAHAHVVAAGEQSRPRRAAHGLGHIKIRELPSLLRHAIEVRRGVSLRAKRPDVRVAHVINENDDDVGRWLAGFGRERKTKQSDESKK